MENVVSDKTLPVSIRRLLLSYFVLSIFWYCCFVRSTIFQEKNGWFLLGWVGMFAVSLGIMWLSKNKLLKETQEIEESENNSDIKSDNIAITIVKFLIFPTRMLYSLVKASLLPPQNEIDEKKGKDNITKLGIYVANKNWYDIGISILIFLIFATLPLFSKYDYAYLDYSKWFIQILKYAIIFRTISRSFELIIAFGNDCFNKENRTNIAPQRRQILAISSLTENIFNYAVVYHLLEIQNYKCLWQSFVLSFQTNFFQELKLNIEPAFPDQASLLILLQFVTSFTLIIFSIAMYASGNKNTTS